MNLFLSLFAILIVTPTLVHYFKRPLLNFTSEIIDEMYSQADPINYTLDVKEDAQRYTWKFSPEWFQYFNFTAYIAEDVDYNETLYTVGFPPGFTVEESLNDTEGIWMMRHDNLPADPDHPVAQLNFSTLGESNREFDIVNITCYLNANATLRFIHPKYGFPLTFKHPNDSDVEWYTFSVDKGPFREFRLEMLTPYDSTEAFVMIDKIVLTKVVVVENSTTGITSTTTEHEHIASSTEVSKMTSTVSEISTEVNPGYPGKGNSILNSKTIVSIMFAVLLVYNSVFIRSNI